MSDEEDMNDFDLENAEREDFLGVIEKVRSLDIFDSDSEDVEDKTSTAILKQTHEIMAPLPRPSLSMV